MTQPQERSLLWLALLEQVKNEYQQLDTDEIDWIRTACARIESLQRRLDDLFCRADGETVCRTCRGDCCALGHNHLSLANLLTFLSAGQELPPLDFAQTCPVLGPDGCRLSPDRRPYNCISFLCDRIENRLAPAQVEEFYHLEQELRRSYQRFAERYSGGSMSGLLLAFRRLKGRPLLQRRKRVTTTTGED